MGSDPGNKKVPDETVYVSSRTIECTYQSRCHLDSQGVERSTLRNRGFSASGSSGFRHFFSACALNWIPAYPWQLTYASRREILEYLIWVNSVPWKDLRQFLRNAIRDCAISFGIFWWKSLTLSSRPRRSICMQVLLPGFHHPQLSVCSFAYVISASSV